MATSAAIKKRWMLINRLSALTADLAEAHYDLALDYLFLGDKGSALEDYKILKDLDKEKANKLFNLIYK